MFAARNVAYFCVLDATMQTDRKQPTQTLIKEKKCLSTKKTLKAISAFLLDHLYVEITKGDLL
jgi:hypothetical protein